MSGIKDEIVEAIISRAKIEEVVSDFIPLRKKSVRYLGLCPFHDDRSIGSFVVYPRKNCFVCFACGEKGGCVDFVMKYSRLSFPDAIRYLGKKYNIETDVTDFNYTPPPPQPAPPPLPMLVLPMQMVTAREVVDKPVSESGNLVRWIYGGIKWDNAQLSRIGAMLHDYHIGLSRQWHTIFWQIDEQGRVRTGKMMKYRPDGHRDKQSKWSFDFIHSTLFRDKNHPEYDESKQEMKQTLFGMHLLNKYGHGAVNIVESEKTALLMSIAYGNNVQQVWMACGGLENLTRERLAPIISARRDIVLYPDRDGIDKWKAKASHLQCDRISINTDPVTKWWKEADGPKADIADVVVRIINEHTPMRTIDEVAERVPPMRPMIKDLGLEIEPEET